MPARPDVVAAMMVRTRQLPLTNAITQGRVSGRLKIFDSQNEPDGWVMPTTAIVWRKVPGPTTARPGTVPISKVPIQYECYAKSLMTADALARTLLGELFPDPPESQSFIAAHCAVISIAELGAGAPILESMTDFPRVVGTLFVEYCERPV